MKLHLPKWYEPIYNLIKDYKLVTVNRADLNYMIMPVTRLEPNEENANYMNSILEELDKAEFKPIKRTQSGGVSIDKHKYNPNSYDLRCFSGCIEITIISIHSLRIQLGTKLAEDESGKAVSGTKAFTTFKNTLKKFGINIDDYTVDNGAEINTEIVKPKIECTLICPYTEAIFKDINCSPILDNVHHLDFHKAYMSQLYIEHPEFKPAIDWLYNLNDKSIKSVFTNSIGFMHSPRCKYKYAGLAKEAINNFNIKLDEISDRLIKSGRKIIAYNTDGIWYQGDIYHDELEGPYLTQWSNDYINCKIRFKSHGAYEFIGTDTKDNKVKYKPVIRGLTIYDRLKPDRSTWEWGDIFREDADATTFFVKTKINRIGVRY